MVSFIPHCMNEFLSAKIMGFLSTRLSLPRIFGRFEWKMRIKSIHNGREDPVEDCYEICFLTLQQPFKIKSNKENEVF